MRLTEENGYPTPDYILSAMNSHRYRTTVGRLDAKALITLAGISGEAAARLTLQPEGKPRAYVRLQGNDIPAYEVVTVRPKVCPQCLAEGGICEAFWDLAQAAACPIHGVMLVDRCAGCGERLSWTRAKTGECRCGFDLAALPMQKAPSALCELMAMLRYAVYRNPERVSLPAEMQHLAHLSLRKLCKLLWVMSGTLYKFQGGRMGNSSPKERRTYKPQLERIAEALSDWPSGYQKYLLEIHADELVAPEGLPNFRTTFNWLLVRLIKHDEDDGDDYAFLLEQTYSFGAGYWPRGAMVRSEADACMLPAQMKWGTMSEASEVLGMHMATLKKLIASGEIPTRRIAKGSERRGLILDLDWARQQKQSEYRPVSIRVACKHLGMSISVLKELRKMGVCQERYRTFPGSIAWEDVESFSLRIDSLAEGKPKTRLQDAITIDEAMKGYDIAIKERVLFAQQIIKDPSLTVGRRGSGFGSLQISISTADLILRKGVVAARSCISVRESAKRLTCTIAEVAALKRDGYLEEDQSRGRRQICRVSLERFDQRYEVMRSIARRATVPVKRIYARINLRDIKHIKVSSTQHSTVFVLRDHVPVVEQMARAITD